LLRKAGDSPKGEGLEAKERGGAPKLLFYLISSPAAYLDFTLARIFLQQPKGKGKPSPNFLNLNKYR